LNLVITPFDRHHVFQTLMVTSSSWKVGLIPGQRLIRVPPIPEAGVPPYQEADFQLP
jgi:hypothetical protein